MVEPGKKVGPWRREVNKWLGKVADGDCGLSRRRQPRVVEASRPYWRLLPYTN